MSPSPTEPGIDQNIQMHVSPFEPGIDRNIAMHVSHAEPGIDQNIAMHATPLEPDLVEFTYLVFTRMSGESYRRRLRSVLLCLCDVFRALINSFAC